MTRHITLVVNDSPIELDFFVAGYLDHIAGGIIASLKGTGEIEKLKITVGEKGVVKIILNNADVPINYFAEGIIRNTLQGAVSPLKGVDKDKPLQNLELDISR